jgi:prophage DNA circulation protein
VYVTELADAVATGLPVLTTYTVEADTTLLAWAHATYGDSSRADEVLALNPWISDPLLLLAGSEVRAYAP